jgi:hypothetical protein
MKRLLSLLTIVVALAAIAASAADATKMNGYISDSMCGAKHLGDNAACVKKCIKEMGSTPVFVDEDSKSVWTIENPDAVKDYYGDHVTVVASADSDKKSVHIDSIAEAK